MPLSVRLQNSVLFTVEAMNSESLAVSLEIEISCYSKALLISQQKHLCSKMVSVNYSKMIPFQYILHLNNYFTSYFIQEIYIFIKGLTCKALNKTNEAHF